jgi:four helix bundle protein
MRDHKKPRAFVLADEVALFVYRITKSFPKEERYGLTAQMRRAAASTASNIVEGSSRESEAEYIRFLEIAFGFLRELHYQLGLSIRLEYTSPENASTAEQKLSEAERVLAALLRSLRQR